MAELLVVLFEKNGTARIAHKLTNGRKAHVTSTILHFDRKPKKG